MEHKHVTELPVTRTEMIAILQPMYSCLQHMEILLQDLSKLNVREDTLVDIDRTPVATESVKVIESPKGTDQDRVKGLTINCSARQSGSSAGTPSRKDIQFDRTCNAKANSTGEGSMCGLDVLETNKSSDKSNFGIDAIDEHDLRVGLDLIEQLRIRKVLQQQGVGGNQWPWVDKLIKSIKNCCDWWASIKEPDRQSVASRIIRSGPFETLVRLSIIVNSVIIAVSADWQIHHIGEKEPQVFSILEAIFFTLFAVELLLRLFVHGYFYFLSEDFRWNLLDFVLVAISVVDFILGTVMGSTSNNNVAFMRLLRFLKLARMLRSLRSFRFFKSLSVLLDSFYSSFMSLFWGFVMLFFVLYLFALIFLQAFVQYLEEYDVPREEVDAIKLRFGSLGQALLSLYMCVTGGVDWVELHELLKQTGAGYAFIFVFFTFFFLFCIFNILTGSLVEKAMASSKPDRTDLILSQRKALHAQKQEFLEICQEMDVDKNGTISWPEFKKWLNNPVMLAYIQTMGMDIHDARLFFRTVGARRDNKGKMQKGEVSIEHFVEGFMNMKGSASAIDMQRQLFETHILHHDLLHVESGVLRELKKLEQLINSRGPESYKTDHLSNLLADDLKSSWQACHEASGHRRLRPGPLML